MTYYIFFCWTPHQLCLRAINPDHFLSDTSSIVFACYKSRLYFAGHLIICVCGVIKSYDILYLFFAGHLINCVCYKSRLSLTCPRQHSSSTTMLRGAVMKHNRVGSLPDRNKRRSDVHCHNVPTLCLYWTYKLYLSSLYWTYKPTERILLV